MQKIQTYTFNLCSSGQLFPFFFFFLIKWHLKKIQNISTVSQYNPNNILRGIISVCAVLIGNG